MSSLPVSARTFDFDTDPAPSRKINPTQVDTQFDEVHAYLNDVRGLLNYLLRSDDTLNDGLVRLRNLALEVSTIIASQGWQPKAAVNLATTANIALTGEQTIDGVLTSSSRVLVRNQTTPSQNGIYVSSAGAWTRALDAATASGLGYAAVTVLSGTSNGGKSFVVTSAPSAITLDTTSIEWAQFGGTSSGGGGGSSSSSSDWYNVKDSTFGAIGDGTLRTLTADEAASYNAAFAVYGAQGANAIVAGDPRDWAAIQCAVWKAANTGERVYMPPGLYRMGSKTLRLAWTGTPITGQPQRPIIGGIFGAGHDATQLAWDNLGAGAVSLELLGESNPYAVRTQIANFRIYHYPTCNAGAVCLRVGDCKELFSAYRVFCEGANGMQLKIASSATYAQLCTHFVECKFDANYGAQWTQTGGEFFSVYPDSGGALWDNVLFDSCEFGGLVYCRAILATFLNCQFYSNTRRAAVYDGCLYAPIGRVTCRDCYFEDYRVAVLLTNGISDNRGALIDGCHFSGTVNDVGAPLAKHAVQIIGFGVNKLGMFTITNNHMNFAAYSLGVNGHHQGDSDGVDIKAPGTRIFLSQNVNIYDPYAAVTLDVTGSYLFSFDASDTAGSGIGRITTYRIRTLDQCEMAAGYVPRKGTGAANGDSWGISVQNAGGTDVWSWAWSSTTYTTGGGLAWLGNDMAYEYIPPGKVKRLGFGTSPLYYEFAYALCTIPGGIKANTGQDITLVSNVPHVLRFVIPFASVAALGAVLTGNVNIVGLPAGVKVKGVTMRLVTPFVGPATLTCSIGTVATPTKYAPAFNVKGAADTFQDSNLPGLESFTASTNLVAAFTATGTNLNTVSAGSLTVCIELAKVEG